MSKLDRLKEELAWLKVVFSVFALIDVSLVAWIAQNYGSASRLLVVASFLGAFSVTSTIIWINRKAMKRFKALEDE